MNTAYCFALDLPQALPAALETLRAALAAEQMGVVSEVDVQATLKTKLGLDSHPQRLLGAVSYTHLDVYKRQPRQRCKRALFPVTKARRRMLPKTHHRAPAQQAR